MTSAQHPRPERIDLGNGLIARWSTRDDAEQFSALLAEAFKWWEMAVPILEDEIPGPNEVMRVQAIGGWNIAMSEYDVALVENTLAKDGEQRIVASVALTHAPGYYGSVPLEYGKPELVATWPEYRNRGLIRLLFDKLIHPLAEKDRQYQISFIMGIPAYYRRFEYEYALRPRQLRLIPNLDVIPKAPQTAPTDEETAGAPQAPVSERFTLRPITPNDYAYCVKMSTPDKTLGWSKPGLGLVYDEAYWQYTVHTIYEKGTSIYDGSRMSRIVVDSQTGQDVGVAVTSFLGKFQWEVFVLEDPSLYYEATPQVLRGMVAIALDEYPPFLIRSVYLALDPLHPAMRLLENISQPVAAASLGDKLYVRIPSFARFFTTVAQTLEERLAAPPMAGLTALLQIEFYREPQGCSGNSSQARGVELEFRMGRLISSQDWTKPDPEALVAAAQERKKNKRQQVVTVMSAGTTIGAFTRLVTGELSVDQGKDAYPDSKWKNVQTKLLLESLFPPQLHHFDHLYW
ncbi:hypothetical protein BGW41_007985 [Actinomortierella wolfii]|nr:hypothetical protein BGW41_007985 [Actinomortierella wolfii]